MIGATLQFVAEFLAEGAWEGVRPKPGPGMCARCRKAPAAEPVAGAGAGMVCERCATLVARNHRAGELFFFGIAALMGLVGILLGVLGYKHGSPLSATEAALFLVVGVGLPATIGWGIRALTRPRRSTGSNSIAPVTFRITRDKK